MQFRANPMRILSFLLLIAVANVYVFAGTAASASNEAGSSRVLLGKLVTTSNRPIVVNGGEAITGTTVLSGAQLVTSAAGGAAVELNNLGTVMIAPSSNVILTFDSKNVVADVRSGWAAVTTVDGVKGSVLGLPASANAPKAPVPAGGNSAKNWGIAGVAIGSAGFIWAIIAWNKANNAQDDADAANASAASLASQLAALRTCLAGQTTSPLKLCTSF